jgi:2-oxoglutarate ferredoxin oxidoreductase subunit gamma
VVEIRFSGLGGQGIIRSGFIVGMATSIFDGKNATMNQAFGPEARGSACSSQLIVSPDPVLYPYLTGQDILVAMSQDAFVKFLPELRNGGTLLIDEDLVKFKDPGRGIRTFSIPATRFAEDLGNRIAANVVMLGFFTAVTDVVTLEAMEEAVPKSVPSRFVELNMNAFRKGYEYGVEQAKEKSTKSRAKKKK